MIHISVPGRICLFGEHQDYLKLPVITAAINRRLTISGKAICAPHFKFALPDINSSDIIALSNPFKPLPYRNQRDYLRSVINLLAEKGIEFKQGADLSIESTIPINSGTSSSSAMIVAWIAFLLKLHPQNPLFSAKEIAILAYLAEVEAFGEPGGMMDQLAVALGGLSFITFNDQPHVEALPNPLKTFVLGDSAEPKETTAILGRVKMGVLNAVELIKQKEPEFAIQKKQNIEAFAALLTDTQYQVLLGAIENYAITLQAKALFTQTDFNHKALGDLLNTHQAVLDKKLQISTPKINGMIDAALDAGALGAKINGSGGGGCMFAYAPENPQKVKKAIEQAGGKAYIIEVDCGLTMEKGDIS